MKSGNILNYKSIELNTSFDDDIIVVEAFTETRDVGTLQLTMQTGNKISITTFAINRDLNFVFTKEQLKDGLKGLGRIMFREALQTGLSNSLFTKDYLITTSDLGMYPMLEKLKFEKKDGILQQEAGVVIDALTTQIDSLRNGFAPVGAGAYGCVFIPHLPSEGVSADAPRDPRLISKLMTIDDARDEFDEQIAVKEQLKDSGILDDEYEEKQYLFSIGGVQKVGDVTELDLTGYEVICKNFSRNKEYDKTNVQNPKTRSNFRKLDGLNGGRDLEHWRKNLTPTVLKDMVTAFGKKSGLIDAIVKMNNADVFHSDMKGGNLVWKGGKNKIGIIDWGLAHVDDDGENWGTDADFPMRSWMWNAPIVSIMFKGSFQRMMDHLEATKYEGNDRSSLLKRLVTAVMDDFSDEKKSSSWPHTHLGTHVNMVKGIMASNSIVSQTYKNFNNTPSNFTKDEKVLMTVMADQLLSIYEKHPRAIGGNGRGFWEDVYKHNSDIWGAMTALSRIGDVLASGDMITAVNNGEYGDVTLLSKIRHKVFISDECQSGKIDIDSLKTDLLAFADTIPVIEEDELFFENVPTVDEEMTSTSTFRKNELLNLNMRSNYMSRQPELNWKMRDLLIDWVIEVHGKYNMFSETLYQTVILIDEYLASGEIIKRQSLQAVGIVALKISSANNNDRVVTNEEMIYVCAGAYSTEFLIDMEKEILKFQSKTDYKVISAYELLLKYLNVSDVGIRVSKLSMFALESTLQSYTLLEHPPTKMAAASLYLARRTDGLEAWDDAIESFTGYKEIVIKPIADIISVRFKTSTTDLTSVKRKYKRNGNGGFENDVFG
jgi:hypothetical protein